MKVIAEMCGFRKVMDIYAPINNPPRYIRVRVIPRLDIHHPEKSTPHDLQLKFVRREDTIPIYSITIEEVLEQCQRQ